MKKNPLSFTPCLAVLALGLLATSASAEPATALNAQKSKDSYAIGVDLARNLKRRGVQMEAETLLQGVRDVLVGGKLLMTEDDLRDTLRALQADERQRAILARQGKSVVADETGARSAAFLDQNRTNPGVVCLPSGLQYKVLKTGAGPRPAAADAVECRFLGTLIDGRAFAGSDPAAPPVALKLSEVIPGLREGLQLMPAGSKWQFVIPPQLAYGEQGTGRARLGPKIGPNAALIYEVELLAIKAPAAKAASDSQPQQNQGKTI